MARRLAAVAAAAFVSFSVVALAGPMPTRETGDAWIGDFETGDLSQWTGVQRAEEGRIRIVTDPVRDGNYAARFEVLPGDYPVGRSGERAELYKATPDRPGTEWYYAWSTLFPDDFTADANWKHMFVQWHGPGLSSGTGVSFQVWHDRLVARVGSPYTPTLWAQYELGPLVRSAWQDFIFHVRWGADKSAFVEIWRNGVRVVSKRHHVNSAPAESNYLKLGYYRDPSPTPAVVYDDGMRRGRALEDVVQPFQLQFVSPPVLRGRILSLDARTFAGARVIVALRRARSARLVRIGVIKADGSGHLLSELSVPRPLHGATSMRLRALIDPALGRSTRIASAVVARP